MMPMCTKQEVSRRHQSPLSVYGPKFAPQASRFSLDGLIHEAPDNSIPMNTATLMPNSTCVASIGIASRRCQGDAITG